MAFIAVAVVLGSAYAQQAPQAPQPPRGKSSFMPVDITEPFSSMFAQKLEEMWPVEREHNAGRRRAAGCKNRPAAGVTMDRKAGAGGVRVKLRAGTTWDSLAGMTPEDFGLKFLFPPGFLPLPHPKQSEWYGVP